MAPPIDYTTAIAGLDDAIKQRYDLIDEMQKLLQGNSDVFNEIDNKLKTATDHNEIDRLATKAAERYKETYKTLDQNFEDIHNQLTQKLDAINTTIITDATARSRVESKKNDLKLRLDQLNTARDNLQNSVGNQINDMADKIKGKIKNNQMQGVNFNITDEINTRGLTNELGDTSPGNLINAAKTEAARTQKGVNDLVKDRINEQLRELQSGNNIVGSALFILGLTQFGRTIQSGLGFGENATQALSSILTLPISRMIGNLKNFTDTVKGYFLQVKALFDMVAGIGKGLLAIPLRIIQFAATQGHEIKAENIKFFNNLEKFQDSFRQSSGVGQSFAGLNKELRGRRISYLDPNNPAARLYGAKGDNLIERQLEESATIIKSMGPRAELMAKAVTRNVTAADASVANYYYKAKKLMNLSDEDMGKLTNMAISLGKSFPEVFNEISEATADVAKRFSLDFKMMSADVLTLRKDIVNFGHKSADELATVAGHIRQMGVSMSDAMAVFNKFQTFEDAATTAAQLSQTFGMVVDSMELLKAQSPDEILQQYKDAFQASGKSFETMDRFSKSLILQQTGLSDQAAQALFSAENAGKTYEEIMADIEAKDPVKQQTKHMEEMRDAIVELKDTLSDKFTSFFDAMQEGFTQKLFENPTIRRAMERMAVAMDNIFLKFTKMDLRRFEPMIKRMTAWIDKLSEFLTSPKFIQRLEKVAFAIGDIIDGFTMMNDAGQLKIEKGLSSLRENIQPIYEFLAGIGAEILKNTAMALINALPGILGAINNTLDNIINYFKDPTKFDKALTGMFSVNAQRKIAKNLQDIALKVFGDKSKGGQDKGLIGRIVDLFEVLFSGPDSIGQRIVNTIKNGFNELTKDAEVQKSLSAIGASIIKGIPFEQILTIVRGEIFGTGITGWLAGVDSEALEAARRVTQTIPSQDLIISDKGSFSLDSKDDIMALKPGGAIEEYMKMAAGNSSLNLNRNNMQELKTMIVEAMTASLQGIVNNSGGDRELVVNLDSQKVGSVLIKGGLATMMTNPNIAGSQPILNPTSITTANGQSYSSPYRNS
jgi:hypothetical protein